MSIDNPPGSGKKVSTGWGRGTNAESPTPEKEPAPFLPTEPVAGVRGNIVATSEPMTPAEQKKALSAAVQSAPVPAVPKTKMEKEKSEGQPTIVDAPKESAAPDERARMQEAETKYLTAYRELEQKRTLLKRLLRDKNFTEETEKVDALKREYDDARIAYAKKINAGVSSVSSAEKTNPLEESGFTARTRKTYEEKKEAGEIAADLTFEAFLAKERLERRERVSGYLQFREVVRPLAQKKYEARKEALDARGKGILEKSLQWTAKQNQKLEKQFGKKGALAIRALVGATVLAAPAALGGLTAAVVVGGGVSFARILIASPVIGGIAKATGVVYEQALGRKAQEAAGKELITGDVAAKGGVLTTDTLQRIDTRREKIAARADEKTLQEKKALVQVLTAFGLGAGAAGAIAALEASHTAVDAVTQAAGASEAGGGTPASAAADGASEASTSGVMDTAAAPESAPVENAETPPAPQPEQVAEVAGTPVGEQLTSATIERGEGFNHLFARLEVSGIENPSVVAAYLADHTPSELSAKVQALVGGESALVHPGDRVFLDANQNLFFERPGEAARLIMENPPSGTEPIFHDVGLELRATPAPAPAVSSVTEVVNAATDSGAPGISAESAAGVVGETSADVGQDLATVPETGGEAPLGATEEMQPRTIEDSIRDATTMQSGSTEGAVQPESIQDTTSGRTIEDSIREAQQTTPDFTNAHGVEINPQVPAAYQWQMPGSDMSIVVASGGTLAEQMEWAQGFAAQNPGTPVYFTVLDRDPSGVATYRVDAWQAAPGGGEPVRFEQALPPRADGTRIQTFNPQDFTRKLP